MSTANQTQEIARLENMHALAQSDDERQHIGGLLIEALTRRIDALAAMPGITNNAGRQAFCVGPVTGSR